MRFEFSYSSCSLEDYLISGGMLLYLLKYSKL